MLPQPIRSSQRLRRCYCSVRKCMFSRRTLSALFCLRKSVCNCISVAFRAAAFWGWCFLLGICLFLTWTTGLCSGGTLFRYVGFHPTPHKGTRPLDPDYWRVRGHCPHPQGDWMLEKHPPLWPHTSLTPYFSTDFSLTSLKRCHALFLCKSSTGIF